MSDDVPTIKEVDALLKLAEKTVYAMAQAGETPAFKIRGAVAHQAYRARPVDGRSAAL